MLPLNNNSVRNKQKNGGHWSPAAGSSDLHDNFFHLPFRSQRDLEAFADAEACYYFGRNRDGLSFEERNALLIMAQLEELTECPPDDAATCRLYLHCVSIMLSSIGDSERVKQQHEIFRKIFHLNDWLDSDEGHAALLALLEEYPISDKDAFLAADESILETSYRLFVELASGRGAT